jgi:thioredoxin 1|tara:strand:+ start:192 stop:515 length:324 start_codon:yes stop_codon:yes gene_type:complete
MIDTIDDAYFKDYISSTATPIIVDFWAEWCTPCKLIAPILDELDKNYKDSLKIAKIDIDFNSLTPVQYEIRSIPTLLFFKDGVNVGRTVGNVNKKLILDKLEHLKLL